MNWENDAAFVDGARMVWPEDVELARSYAPRKGRAAARERMARRYDGWMLLRKLDAMATACAKASEQLRAEPAWKTRGWPS